jgi:HK97 family phage portal protein
MRLLQKLASALKAVFSAGSYRGGLLSLPATSSTGVAISEHAALSLSTVWACVRAISDPIGFLPLHVYRRTRNGRERAVTHPAYRLLHDSPDGLMTACEWRSAMQAHVLTHGNAFSRILWASGTNRVIGLELLHPAQVSLEELPDGGYRYVVATRRGRIVVEPADMLHIRGPSPDGRWGYSVIALAREAIGLAAAMEQYGAQFFRWGGRTPYVLEHPGGFRTAEELEAFRQRWREAYHSTEAWHQALILTGGMKYQSIGITPEDAQFLASRQFQVTEICRWFRVSPHLVADLSRATFSNIEHLGIEFLTQTLAYWLKLWEQQINLKLLGQEFYAEFDVNALVRGDYASRTRGYATLLQNGVLSVNEVRELENRNPVDGGDVHHIQLNMQPLVGARPAGAGGRNAGDSISQNGNE